MENVKEYLKNNLKMELVVQRTFLNSSLHISLTLENEEIAKCNLEDLVYLIEDTIDDTIDNTVERSVEDANVIRNEHIEHIESKVDDLEDRIQYLEDSMEEDKA